ncbi:taste receptor type 2 member 8-like [Hyperolius riggenbachi]|uniref:taste receptor type 2 member 8-like n=1 Tax=Hyperolius riggenbachi TaxID=752182 RepID=UPI0035A3B9B5
MEPKSLGGLLCFALISLESFIGIVTNSFIIFMILFSYFKYHKVSSTDKIIVGLSISNTFFACIAYVDIMIYYFWPVVFVTSNIVPAVFTCIMFNLTTSSWLTASLSFFYFVKIKNYSLSFFSWLRNNINSLVPWMILTSVGLAFLSAFLNIIQFTLMDRDSQNLMTIHVGNTSWSFHSTGVFPENLYISFISCIVPFMISVMATGSATWSLNLHRLKMLRKNTVLSSNGNMQKYSYTIRIMIRLVIFYGFFYTIMFLFYFNIYPLASAGFWAFLVIMCSYSPTQSILLCLATIKLRKACRKIFHCSAESIEESESRED